MMSDADEHPDPKPGTVEAAIPEPLREAIFAAADLYTIQMREPVGAGGLFGAGPPAMPRLCWRGGVLRAVEVRGLPDPFFMPSLPPDEMDIAITLQNAGFVSDDIDEAPVWFWSTP